jgi:tape measure domain-containing protein
MAEAGELVVRVKADASDLEKGLSSASRVAETQMAKISKAILAAGVAYKAFEFIGKGIEFNKAAEQAQVAFSVMTGSAEKATEVLKELKDFANTTPLEFADIRDATQTMLSFGIAADDATKYIRILGDISGGNADKLKSISLAFGQIASTGRLMGQDLLQLINAGFNPLQEISARTGRSMGDLKADMEKGLISFDMVEKAFIDATSEGGRFFGMLEKQGQTVAGKLSTATDALDTMLGALTESLSGPLKLGAEGFTAIANAISGLPAGARAAITVLGGLGAALGATAIAAKKLGFEISASFGPIGIAVAAATAAVVAFNASAEEAMAKQNAEIKRYQQGIAEYFGLTGDQAQQVNERLAESVWVLKKFGLTAGELNYGNTFSNMAKEAGVSNAVFAEAIVQSSYLSVEIKNVAQQYRNLQVAQKVQADADKARIEELRKRHMSANQARLNEQQLLEAKIEEDRQSAHQANVDRIEAINRMVRNGLITRLEADKKIIEVHESVIKQYDNQILAGNRLSASEERDYKDRIKKIADLEKKSIESVRARMDARRKASLEEQEIERKLTESANEQFNLRSDYLIAMYEAQDADAREAFERRQLLLTQESDAWKSATDFISGQLSGLSTGLSGAADAFGSAMKSAIKDGTVSATDISKMSVGIMQSVFEFQEAGINKNLKLALSAIDKETKAKLIAAGIEMNTAEKAYNEYRNFGDQKEKDEQLLSAQRERDIAQQSLDEIKASETSTYQQRKDAEKILKQKQDALMATSQGLDQYRDQERLKELEQARDIEVIMFNAERHKLQAKYEADYRIHQNQIMMTIANGAAAIVAGYAQLGPVAGSVAAGVTAGVTAAQIAIMEENKPIRPYAVGTDFAAGGMALVGERGPELVNMPRGSQVFTNGETKDIMRRGTGLSVVVNNYSPEAIDAATSDRMTRRSMRQLAFQGAF